MTETHGAIVLFNAQKIRRTWYHGAWWFSVVDVAGALTESPDPGAYWRKLKQRLNEEESEVVTFCHGLKLPAPDGKMRATDCANTESLLRSIQSIPSPKAEPFKRWLAKVGYERIQEIENPEPAQERMKGLYEEKGYPKDWIDKRLRGMAVRQDLTDEWNRFTQKVDVAYKTVILRTVNGFFHRQDDSRRRLQAHEGSEMGSRPRDILHYSRIDWGTNVFDDGYRYHKRYKSSV